MNARKHTARRTTPIPRRAPLVGLFLLRTDAAESVAPGPVMAKIDGQLYAMVFTNAARANGARGALGVDDAKPFYICDANRSQLVRELHDAGAAGFIVDFDPSSSTYATAGEIPAATM